MIRHDSWRFQQKLHTKLVQKLILTPSLQQAIKLLPMSTLELADLLNQEMVENPLLEEVPTEELQPAEQQAQHGKGRRREAERREDRPVGRRRLRVFLRRLPRRRLPLAHAVRGQRAPADREHARRRPLALRSPAVAAVAADASDDASVSRDRRRHHRQPRRRRLPRGVGRGDRGDGRLAGGRRRARAAARADASIRSASPRATLQECLLAADPAPRARGHADREDRHRAPAAAAEPPGARDRAPAGHDRSRI